MMMDEGRSRMETDWARMEWGLDGGGLGAA